MPKEVALPLLPIQVVQPIRLKGTIFDKLEFLSEVLKVLPIEPVIEGFKQTSFNASNRLHASSTEQIKLMVPQKRTAIDSGRRKNFRINYMLHVLYTIVFDI